MHYKSNIICDLIELARLTVLIKNFNFKTIQFNINKFHFVS